MQDIEKMSIDELKTEVSKLRDAIKGVVTERADRLCWRDVYTELGKLVDIEFSPELIAEPEQFLSNCKQFDKSLREGGSYLPVYVEKNGE